MEKTIKELEEFIFVNSGIVSTEPAPALARPQRLHNVHDWIILAADANGKNGVKRYTCMATTAHAAREKGARFGLQVLKVIPAPAKPVQNIRDPLQA